MGILMHTADVHKRVPLQPHLWERCYIACRDRGGDREKTAEGLIAQQLVYENKIRPPRRTQVESQDKRRSS